MKRIRLFFLVSASLLLLFLHPCKEVKKYWIYFSVCETSTSQISDTLSEYRIYPVYRSELLNAVTAYLFTYQVDQVSEFDFVRDIRPVLKLKTIRTAAVSQIIDPENDYEFYGESLRANRSLNTIPLHNAGITGKNIIIGVIDTGFDRGHDAFRNSDVIAEYDFVNDDGNSADENESETASEDHGTAVWSVAGGYDPGKLIGTGYGASFALAKTEISEPGNPELTIEEDYFVRGLEWLDSLNVDIITSSLAFHALQDADYYTMDDMDGRTSAATRAADKLAENGVLFFNGAGNGFATEWPIITAPADGYNVISIGAVDETDELASFSATGPTTDGRMKPELLAPGIVEVAFWRNNNRYVEYAGTSLASPAAAGAAALLLSVHPDLTAKQAKEALFKTASRANTPENRYGYGLIDAYSAATYFGPAFSNEPAVSVNGKSVEIKTGVISSNGVLPESVTVFCNFDDSKTVHKVVMELSSENNLYVTQVPFQSHQTKLKFFFSAEDTTGNKTVFPGESLGGEFVFDLNSGQLANLPKRNCLRKHVIWP